MVRSVLLLEAGCAPEMPSPNGHLRRLLRQRGYRLQPFTDEAPALAWATEHPPELAIVRTREQCRALKLLPRADPAVVQLGGDGPPQFYVEPDATAAGPDHLGGAIDRALAARRERQDHGIRAEVHARVPSGFAELDEFADLLPGWLAGCGLTAFQVKQLGLAAREVVANAIEWGNRNDRSRLVSVLCRLDDEMVTILVRDDGPGFDRQNLPHAARPGDPLSHLPVRAARKLRDGGFGILLASGLVDHLCYNEAGNESLLVKYLPSTAAVAGHSVAS